MSIRTYYDPLHKGITLDTNIPEEALIMQLIDSSPFQRLRRIRQLGPASLTFHGAESSRFTHSLGVFEISRKALNCLLNLNPDLQKFRLLLYSAALLHDLGHGPFSHTSEGIFNLNHEQWSANLIENHPEISDPLEKFNSGYSIEIANLIRGKDSPNKAIKALISSQLDCDRLDYLIRDSYSTGTNYGVLDLDRIIKALTLSPDGDLAIHPKGLPAVEHYLVTRNLMYKSVYNHRLNEVANWLLEKIFTIARDLGPEIVWADENISKWLWNKNEIGLDDFIANDDIVVSYHLHRWKEGKHKILSELCYRYINRILFKAIDINILSNENQIKALAIARSIASKNGLDPDTTCGIKKQKLHGYHPYKGGLRLWDGKNLKALENASPLVRSLIRPEESTWLIYERKIHSPLKKEIDLLINELN